jgi:hypothetical protein
MPVRMLFSRVQGLAARFTGQSLQQMRLRSSGISWMVYICESLCPAALAYVLLEYSTVILRF